MTDTNTTQTGSARVKLNEAQRSVYFACAEETDSTVYNIAFVVALPASVDPDRFEEALRRVTEKHPAILCGLGTEDGEPFMRPGAYAFTLVRDRAESAEEAKKAFVRPFDLMHGPLFRYALTEVPEGRLFLCDWHHLIMDGTSVRLFFDQLGDAYAGKEIPPEPMTLFEAAERERSGGETPAYAAARAFFKEQLSGAEFDTALLSDLDGKTAVRGCGLFSVPCTGLTCGATEAFTRAQGITEASLFTAAFAYTLAVFGGARECCFTTVTAGRHGQDLSGTVGMFVRMLPLRVVLPAEGSVGEYLTAVQTLFRRTLKNSCLPFGELVNTYGVRADISFVYQGDLISETEIGGSTVRPALLPLNGCQSDLLCMALKRKTGYEIRMQYRTEKYSEALMRSFAATFSEVLSGFLRARTLSDVSLVSPEQRAFIDRFNDTQTALPPDGTVQALFERAAAAYPDREALVFEDRRYTFRDFARITGNIAAYIRKKGLGADDFTAILTPRDDLGVLAAWGAVRARAAMEMLDPSYPPERLGYMVKDSGARLLIADRALRALLPEYTGEVLYTDEIEGLPAAAIDAVPAPSDAITLIYTSGTTGKPKGVVLENRNLTAFFHNHTRTMGIDASARLANYASFGFDAGAMDIITAPAAGACLYIVPDGMRLDLPRVEEYFTKNGITHAFMTTQVGRTFAQETRCPTLKALLVGGEKLVPFTPDGRFRFLNGYGPCETMAYICWHEVRDNSPIQPIGRPAGNTKLYVLDTLGRMLPPGALGELAISGAQVGRGYLGLPEKTAAVFVPDPFAGEPGYGRMYKTGDVVRLLPAGEIEFIGRRDGQVKIRGFRVELTEIEEVIRRFEGVADAAVIAPDAPGGGKYIAAFVTGKDRIDTDALQAFIRAEKPAYMVPAVTVQIDAIPYTQNHKVDRRALPVPQRVQKAARPPRNETEQKIFDLAAEVIGHREFGADTDLFEAGLTSIGTLKLNVSLFKAFGVPVRLSDIKANPSVEALCAFLTASGTQSVCGKEAEYPLMQNQLGVFVDAGLDKETVRYNMPLLMKLSDTVDAERLRAAFARALDAHPFLKATLRADANGEIRLLRHDEAPAETELIRAEKLPGSETLVRPFTLLGGRLYRAAVYVTASGKYLFFDAHHILADGTSLAVLLKDTDTAYAGGAPVPERYTGFEAALEEQKLLSGAGLAAAEAYYEKLLSGANTECLPEKCPAQGALEKSAVYTRTFGACSAAITEYCRKNRLSANAFFNAVFTYTLCAFLHADDITYCTVYNGRNDARLSESVAMLVKTLPVRGCVDPSVRVAGFVSDMQKQLMDTMANDLVPFAGIAKKYAIRSDIFFNYQGDTFTFDSLCGGPAQQLPLAVGEAKAPLSVEMFLENGVYRALLTYATDRYCREFAASFTGALETAAEQFTRAELLSGVSLLAPEEKAYYDAMNATAVPFEPVSAQTFFEREADAHPDRTAVITEKARLSYRELEEKANVIAHALLARGVKNGDIVALIPERSALVPAAELGILKAGAAFLPMLPTYPDDRLEFCLRDAGCRFVISEKATAEAKPALFGADKPFTALALEELLLPGDTSRPAPVTALSQPAYCIYTSGSTGRPKGVLIEQHSLSNFVQTAALRETEARGSTVLCMASVSFDMSVTEIFFSLCRGKTLYIAAEEEVHNPDRLLRAFTEHGIDIMMATPSFMWSLMSMPGAEQALSRLRSVVLGAEAFQPALLAKLKALDPDMLVQNGYGPTECTQVCSVKTLSEGGSITIGSPFANMKFYIADDNGHLLPRYAVGELLIAGENVCRGYVNLPDKDKAAFTVIDGVRAYRSGDLVRINRDNEAEFGGRKDNQVKLRGFRIELDEVEAIMQQYPSVRQSKVVVLNNGSEDYLAGYFTASEPVGTDALTAFMKTKLTYYMVPAALCQLEKMPLTANGKLDKKALPEIRPVRRTRARRAPKKSAEEKILEIFKSVLGQDECYADDNFFEIGGTSLSASKAVMQLKSAGYAIEYQDIFDHQSAEELAEYLEDGKAPAPAAAAPEETPLYTEPEDIREVLKHNAMAYAPQVKREPLGTVLLTGATGFLGIHVLRELLARESGPVICLLRRGRYESVKTRLQASLVYYFEDDCEEAFRSRLRVLEGDITDDDLCRKLGDVPFDTLINCAASVKHYAKDDSIGFVNVHGVENLIRLTKEKHAKMIQISTTSVPGAHTEQTYRVNLRMAEDRLFVIDDMNNQYAQSKYRAELLMLRAIAGGMRGKIIRVGNLMGRYSDGEFQTNMRTNAFLNGLRGFVSIGKCPLSHATDPMNFSPVDCTAGAVVLLAGTNDMFTAFHADNRTTFDEMKLIDTVNRCGITVRPVPDEEYYADFYRMMGDPEKNARVSALLTNDRPDVHPVETDNRFTANVLYRLGFSWPFIDDGYLEKIITSLDTMHFFFEE